MQSENNQEKSGRKYWRSLEEMAETPELLARMKNEFPTGAAELEVTPGVDRRQFLGIIGASAAFAGLTSATGCIRKPAEKILPYNKRPEDLIEGKAQSYASVGRFGGSVFGLLVTSYEGRPTKVDGNPSHPMSLGGSTAFAQASVLDVYDPDRSQYVLKAGVAASSSRGTLKAVKAALATAAAELKASAGQGVALLMEAVPSPTLLALVREFQADYPKATIAIHDPAMRWNESAALELIGFKNAELYHRFESANVIAAFDADPLGIEGDVVRNSKMFAAKRRSVDESKTMSRLYVVEPAFTNTGAVADHRMSLRSSAMGEALLSLAVELAAQGLAIPSEILARARQTTSPNQKWLKALATDLILNKGKNAVLVGHSQRSWVHAVAFAINSALGNVGHSVVVRSSPLPASARTLAELTSEMNRGQVQTLVMLDVNPVYSAPADLEFADALKKVKTSIHLGYHADETALASTWHFPRAHGLECWGDLVSSDGTAAIAQPVIEPLYASLSDVEFLAGLLGQQKTAYEIVQAHWKKSSGADFESSWRRWLHDGVIKSPMGETLSNNADFSKLGQRLTGLGTSPAPTASQLELRLALDRSVYDGRYANNAWLQEIPDSVSKLTWDNAALLSPKTAKDKGIKTGDMVEIKIKQDKERRLKIAAFVVPGIAENTVVVPLGYGRRFNGRVATGAGFDGYALLGRDDLFAFAADVSLAGGTYELATTQEHGVSDYEYDTKVGAEAIKNRGVLRELTLATYKQDPSLEKAFDKFNLGDPKNHRTLLWQRPNETRGNQWGMTIDLNSCTGCNACTAACQAENNISVVGKKRVLKSREMHWIRIDRYFAGNVDNPDSIQAVFQPLACAHCETAPCEQVCPVAATVHGVEGTNDIAYNRCIGTRYCANNCPYKVRRFNYFNYSKENDESNPLYAMQKNPRVTVRFRGVIEKCSYCVQRVNAARIEAKIRGEEVLRDGAVVTACQQVCPTDAISFGNLNDPDSRVSQLKSLPRNYAVLSELALQPRTTFLAKVRNPNPELDSSTQL